MVATNHSRSSISPSASKTGRSNDSTPVPIHSNKPVPLDQLLSQTDNDYNGNININTHFHRMCQNNIFNFIFVTCLNKYTESCVIEICHENMFL